MHSLSKNWRPLDGPLDRPEVHVNEDSFNHCRLLTIISKLQRTTLPSFNRIRLQMTKLWLFLAYNFAFVSCRVWVSSIMLFYYPLNSEVFVVGMWSRINLYINKDKFYRHMYRKFLAVVSVNLVKYEPLNDKTNKVACAPSEDSDQPRHPPSLFRVFAVRMKKYWVLSYPLSAQRRLWSDWADAQTDLSLRWAHMLFCWFCHEAAHIYMLNFMSVVYKGCPWDTVIPERWMNR